LPKSGLYSVENKKPAIYSYCMILFFCEFQEEAGLREGGRSQGRHSRGCLWGGGKGRGDERTFWHDGNDLYFDWKGS